MLPASNRGVGMNLGFPDVCNTPAGPVTVPIPYPNIAMNAQAVPFSPVVKVSMMNALNMSSRIPMTSGDEAGVAHPMFKQAGAYTMGNPIVSIDGMPAINLCCPTTGNNFNNPVGAVLVPSVVNVLYCFAGSTAEAPSEGLAGLLVPEDTSGLVLRRGDGELVVVHVRRGSRGARLGLGPGDRITALAGAVAEAPVGGQSDAEVFAGAPVGGHSDAEVLAEAPVGGQSDADVFVGAPVGGLSDAEVFARLPAALAAPGAIEVRVGGERVRVPGLGPAPALAPARGRMLAAGVGYLELNLFAQDAPTWVERVLAALEAEGLRALVIDVRGNPGGDLEAMLRCGEAWLPRGAALATEREPDGDVRVHRARQSGARTTPLVVLVDRLTASAAELFAGCLQHHRRAVLVGERTFGKGTGWRAASAIDAARGTGQGSELALPDGRALQGRGLEPDVALSCQAAEALRLLCLRHAERVAGHAAALADGEVVELGRFGSAACGSRARLPAAPAGLEPAAWAAVVRAGVLARRTLDAPLCAPASDPPLATGLRLARALSR